MEFEKAGQLKGYIREEVKQLGIHSNYGFNYYFCRNFLERLFGNSKGKFALKGSYAQFCGLKEFVRPFTDIDIVTFDRMEKAKEMLEDTFMSDNKVKFEIKQCFVTTNKTVNYRVMCHFDTISHLITLDLKKDEVFDNDQKDMPKIFSKDNGIYVNAISLEECLAGKLYTVCLNRMHNKFGKQFRRFKDFYDIYEILRLGAIDVYKVYYIFGELIKKDDFLSRYDFISDLNDKEFITSNQQLWNEEKGIYEYKDEVSLEKAVDASREFISKKGK